MCGFMTLRGCQLSLTGVVTGSGASSVKRWFALHSDFVLYTFKAEEDCHALTATPMPGYTVLSGLELKGEPGVVDRDRDRTIKMFYAPLMTSQQSAASVSAACRKAYFFVGGSPAEVKRSDKSRVFVCLFVCLLVFVRLSVSFLSVFPTRLFLFRMHHHLGLTISILTFEFVCVRQNNN
jgi:hypothetical protein